MLGSLPFGKESLNPRMSGAARGAACASPAFRGLTTQLCRLSILPTGNCGVAVTSVNHDEFQPPRPKTFLEFLQQALEDLAPGRGDRRNVEILRLFILNGAVNDGWLSRERIAELWDEILESKSDAVSKGIQRFGEAIRRIGYWIAPHCAVELIADSKTRPTRYKIVVTTKESAWYLKQGFMQPLPWNFRYRFKRRSRIRTLDRQVWAFASKERNLEVTVGRTGPRAQWHPETNSSKYDAERDAYFRRKCEDAKKTGQRPPHDGDIWAIHDVTRLGDEGHPSLHIAVLRTKYSDRIFLRTKLDEICPFAEKTSTYRQWLGIGPEPLEAFIPPIHCLCLSVMLVAYTDRKERSGLTLFVSRQSKASPSDPDQWEVTAAGVVSSSHLGQPEREPRLKEQIGTLLNRETGVPAEKHEINWLGFARAAIQRNSTLFALVEIGLSTKEVLEKFNNRPYRDDVEDMVPVPLDRVDQWLDKIPSENRREFLELGLALTAIRFGAAEVLPTVGQ